MPPATPSGCQVSVLRCSLTLGGDRYEFHPCNLVSKLQEFNPILRGSANYYRHCAYSSRMFTSLGWYIGTRTARWLRKKRAKARSRDIWTSCQPAVDGQTRRPRREGMVERNMLAGWPPPCL
ncbi:group II intron maturase-specific domain-containing protein [Mesorhizobium sp. M0482]|uniref:group II intron maturase-specific domain-containing protein n=1 Tax=Mesorhizobium sp. M0482 TaxID=2956948 RepID=UPI003335B840